MIFLMTIFATSIACASRENQLNNMGNYPSFVNPGAFAAASAFGLFACTLYIVIIVFCVLEFLRIHKSKGSSEQPSTQPSSQVNSNAGSTSPVSTLKHKSAAEEAFNIWKLFFCDIFYTATFFLFAKIITTHTLKLS